MNVDFHEPEDGCCGMAGAFGFEKGDHYDVSIKCGERVLLPAVRDAEEQTILIADGFSCREQISQTTDRHALHLAQVIQLALHDGESKRGGRPEAGLVRRRRSEFHRAAIKSGIFAALGIVAGVAVYSVMKQRRQHDGF